MGSLPHGSRAGNTVGVFGCPCHVKKKNVILVGMGVYGGTTVVGDAPTLLFSCSTLSSVVFYLGEERW